MLLLNACFFSSSKTSMEKIISKSYETNWKEAIVCVPCKITFRNLGEIRIPLKNSSVPKSDWRHSGHGVIWRCDALKRKLYTKLQVGRRKDKGLQESRRALGGVRWLKRGPGREQCRPEPREANLLFSYGMEGMGEIWNFVEITDLSLSLSALSRNLG